MDTRELELRWLARQPYPVWGGHLERGEPITSPQMQAWVTDGIIEAVDQPVRGYRITDKGRALISKGT
jgi:hypothetical protein